MKPAKLSKMTFKHYFFGFAALLFLSQCKEEIIIADCVLPLAEAIPIMENCQNNAIVDSAEIAKHLIGDWKLIGYDCVLCPPHPPSEGVLQISESKAVLILKDELAGNSIMTFDWYLDKVMYNLDGTDTTIVYYRFRAEQYPYHFALRMNTYCSDYMFYESGIDGVQLMLYQKYRND